MRDNSLHYSISDIQRWPRLPDVRNYPTFPYCFLIGFTSSLSKLLSLKRIKMLKAVTSPKNGVNMILWLWSIWPQNLFCSTATGHYEYISPRKKSLFFILIMNFDKPAKSKIKCIAFGVKNNPVPILLNGCQIWTYFL